MRHPGVRSAVSVPGADTARAGHLMAMGSKTPVGPIECSANDGGYGEQVEGICPQDAFHQIPVDVWTLNLSPIRQEQPHILQEVVLLQMQSFRHPPGLQRGDREAVPPQEVFPGLDPVPADPARPVIEDPAFRTGRRWCGPKNGRAWRRSRGAIPGPAHGRQDGARRSTVQSPPSCSFLCSHAPEGFPVRVCCGGPTCSRQEWSSP